MKTKPATFHVTYDQLKEFLREFPAGSSCFTLVVEPRRQRRTLDLGMTSTLMEKEIHSALKNRGGNALLRLRELALLEKLNACVMIAEVKPLFKTIARSETRVAEAYLERGEFKGENPNHLEGSVLELSERADCRCYICLSCERALDRSNRTSVLDPRQLRSESKDSGLVGIPSNSVGGKNG
jgi:hypothetical protein